MPARHGLRIRRSSLGPVRGCMSVADKEEITERVSNQLSNNRSERRDTSADVGGQYELAAWVLAPGEGPTTWLRDEEAMRRTRVQQPQRP